MKIANGYKTRTALDMVQIGITYIMTDPATVGDRYNMIRALVWQVTGLLPPNSSINRWLKAKGFWTKTYNKENRG